MQTSGPNIVMDRIGGVHIDQSSPTYRHTVNLSYELSLLPRGAAYQEDIPASQGLDELTSRIRKLEQGVKSIGGQDTLVTVRMANDDLVLRVESNELYRALTLLFQAAGSPHHIYGNPDVMQDKETMNGVESILNSIGSTMQYDKSRARKDINIRSTRDWLEAWLERREENKSSPLVKTVWKL